jgi:hypothetical protein
VLEAQGDQVCSLLAVQQIVLRRRPATVAVAEKALPGRL